MSSEDQRAMMPAEKVELLRACCCVAGSDGESVASERVLLDKLAREIGVGQASLDAMIRRSEEDPDFHKEQFRILKANPVVSIEVLIQVALADGQFTSREKEVVRALAENLEIESSMIDKLLAAAEDSTK